jgi:hypothetical protein
MAKALGAASLCLALACLQQAASAATITLVGGSIDTSVAPQTNPQTLGVQPDADGRSLVFVQFAGPTQDGWLEACEEMGARVRHYLPEHAYLVEIEADRLGALQALKAVEWAGAVPPMMKVDPSIVQTNAVSGDADIIFLSYGPPSEATLSALGALVQRSRETQMGWHETWATLPTAQVPSIATMGNVFHVQQQPDYQLHGERGAQVAAGNLSGGGDAPVGPGYRDWLDARGLSGAPGVIVQVQDDGLDRGTDDPKADGIPHPDLAGRMRAFFNATSDPLGDSASGHGQINAGIIVGNASVSASYSMDSGGFHRGQGMAPAALVVGTKIFRNNGQFQIVGGRSFTDLAIEAQDAGVTFSNNSWGDANPANFGRYDATAAEFDALTRDADPTEPGNQSITYFFSTGNAGTFGLGSISSPATAKNVISIGAGENSDGLNPPDSGLDGSGIGIMDADDVRELAFFSSRGPTRDGRFGVDLYAVGTHVTGPTVSFESYIGDGVSGRFPASPEKIFPDEAYFPVGQNLYTWSSGTSHSTPLATGAGMLVQEFFNSRLSRIGNTPNPSPSLIKAVLTNSARDNAGAANGLGDSLQPIPSPEQGWGAVNLAPLFAVNPADIFTVDREFILVAFGQVYEREIFVHDTSKPLKISLAWMDAPAIPGASPTLVNDLDLQLVSPNGTYVGNNFIDGWSALGGDSDRTNNVEAIFIQNPEPQYTLRVVTQNLAGDGIPGFGSGRDQDFSLFVWNGTVQSSEGTLTSGRTIAQCESATTLNVSDFDLRGAGSAAVTATVVGAAPGDSETLNLSESVAGTGFFSRTVAITEGAPVPGDGTLQVSHGDVIVFIYTDNDDGTGEATEVMVEVEIDCLPPQITNVRLESQTPTTMNVTYDSDEPAFTTVSIAESCGDMPIATADSSGSVLLHDVTLGGLMPCTPYFARIEARDAAGNMATYDNGGACFPGVTIESVNFFFDSFDGFDFGWTATGLWHLAGVETSEIQYPPLPFPSSAPNRWWYGLDLPQFGNYGFPRGERNRGELRSRVFTLPAETSISLSFRSYEDTEPDPAFDTRKVFVEANGARTLIHQTTLNTSTWELVGPLDLSAFAGQDVRIIFEFDTIDGTSNEGVTIENEEGEEEFDAFTGWGVDDIDISFGARCQSTFGAIRILGPAFRCGVEVPIQVEDTNVGSSTLIVRANTAGGDEEPVLLVEESPGSGVYTGFILTGDLGEAITLEDGRLQGQPTDTIIAIYRDVDVGDGSDALLTDTALLECTPPVISNVQIKEVRENRVVFTFETDRPASAVVRWGLTCNSPPESTSGPVGLTHEIAAIPLFPLTTYFFEVGATDRAGNVGFASNDGLCYKATTLGIETTYFDDFETIGLGWNSVLLSGTSNQWLIRPNANVQLLRQILGFDPPDLDTYDLNDDLVIDSADMVTQVNLLGGPTNHAFTYEPALSSVNDARLITPPLGGNGVLVFDHSFELEPSFDGGVIEYTNDGFVWQDLGSKIFENPYNGVISAIFSSTIGGRAAWTGGTFGPTQRVQVDLTEVDPPVRVGFRIATDRSISSGGWLIDNVRFLQFFASSNSDPVAADDVFQATSGQAQVIAPLSNDTDPDGNPLTLSGVFPPPNGSITALPNGTAIYTSNPGFTGIDSFVYTVRDNKNGGDTARITINVIP